MLGIGFRDIFLIGATYLLNNKKAREKVFNASKEVFIYLKNDLEKNINRSIKDE